MRMRVTLLALAALTSTTGALISSTVELRAQEKKDYLSETEADKIREATNTFRQNDFVCVIRRRPHHEIKIHAGASFNRSPPRGTIERDD